MSGLVLLRPWIRRCCRHPRNPFDVRFRKALLTHPGHDMLLHELRALSHRARQTVPVLVETGLEMMAPTDRLQEEVMTLKLQAGISGQEGISFPRTSDVNFHPHGFSVVGLDEPATSRDAC